MITFPTTPESFIAYQEQLIGRALSMNEKEATVAWLECFNLSYEDGQEHDRDALDKNLNKLKKLMDLHKDNAGVHKFAEDCLYWMMEAWKQGAERSELK